MAVHIVIALAFAALVGVTYYYLQQKNAPLGKQDDGRMYALFIVSLVFGVILRMILAYQTPGYSADMSCFRAWSGRAFAGGFSEFYDITGQYFCDYPPGYIYILYLLGGLQRLFGLDWNGAGMTLLLKFPAILFDVLTACVLLRLCMKRGYKRAAYLTPLFVIFNPALVFNSSVWGQIDSVFTFFLLLSVIYLCDRKYLTATIFYAFAFLIKPQALMFAPIIFLAVLFEKKPLAWFRFRPKVSNAVLIRVYNLLSCLAVGFVIFLIFCLPFSNASLFYILQEKYFGTMFSYKYASVNAFNLYALFGLNYAQVTPLFSALNYVFMAAIIAAAVYLFWKRKEQANQTAFIAMLSTLLMFLLLTQMHERYLYPAVLLCFLWYVLSKDRRMLLACGVLSVAQYINVSRVLNRIEEYVVAPHDGYIVMTVLLLVAAAAFLGVYAYRHMIRGIVIPADEPAVPVRKGKGQTKNGASKPSGKQTSAKSAAKLQQKKSRFKLLEIGPKLTMKRLDVLILTAILLVYGVVTFYNLGDMKAPQTAFEPVSAGDSFVVDLGRQVQISQINFYSGVNMGDYSLRIAPTRETLDSANPIALKIGTVFYDHSETINQSGQYLKFTANEAPLMLQEIAVYEQGGDTPVSISGIEYGYANNPNPPQNLFDEQEIIQKTANYRNSTYFDEIYHARTGYEFLHGLAPYETTHPPLGKAIIAGSIGLFGMTPFGWRAAGALFGVLGLLVMYLLSKRIFGKTSLAVGSTLLFAFDFMHLTLSRISTVDAFTVVFVMLSVYFMVEFYAACLYHKKMRSLLWPLLFSGLFLGMAGSTKWNSLYVAIALVIVFILSLYRLYQKGGKEGYSKKLTTILCSCVGFFGLVPLAVYVVSYIPYYHAFGSSKGFFQTVMESQKLMFSYHSQLTATHPYQSSWWEWMIDKRPLWMSISNIDGKVSSISCFGNPLIWWTGLGAIAFLIGMLVKNRGKGHDAGWILLLAFVAQLLPWVFVSRVTFIYHYYNMTPFLILMISYAIYTLNFKKKWSVYTFYVLCGLLFVMFFPVTSGTPVAGWYLKDVLTWFPTWVFGG